MRTYIIKRKHKITAFLLGMTVFCSGCGNSSVKIPKLIEPVGMNAVYRPVEYGSTGENVVIGTVEPEDYCNYYDVNVTISKLMVSVGDTVEAGDILAYADVDAAKESLADYQEQLSYENASYEWNQKLSQKTIEKLEYQKMKQETNTQDMAQQNPETNTQDMTQQNPENAPQTIPEDTTQVDTGDTPSENTPQENTEGTSQGSDMPKENQKDTSQSNAGVPEQWENTGGMQNGNMPIDYDKQISIEKENAHYDAMLHEYRVQSLQKSIESTQKIVNDGTLTARHGGQVTYIKNLVKGREAGANENIVIVSDLTELHIELKDLNLDDYNHKYSDFQVKYIMMGGEKIPLTEEEYSTEEAILSTVNQHFPNVRFQCPEGYNYTVGDTYPVYFTKADVKDTLIVGNDSLYAEGDKNYVYVKNDAGKQEKRFIEVGISGESYTEVISGLSEGEQVYYHSTSAAPSEYTEYTVSLSDFVVPNYGPDYEKSSTNVIPCQSEYEGEITEIAVTVDQEVEEGDLLYVIDTGEGKAAIAGAQNAIDQENTLYQQKLSSINDQIESFNAFPATDDSISYELQILEIQKEMNLLEHKNTLSKLQKEYNKISEGNDGTGKISVYAPVSGTVCTFSAAAGDKIEAGSEILQISNSSSEILLVQMVPDSTGNSELIHLSDIADVGEKVTIRKEDNVYEGTCVGWGVADNNLQKGYVYTDEQGEPHLSYYGSQEYNFPAFYVKMDDPSVSFSGLRKEALQFTYASLHDVIAVPTAVVYSEADPMLPDKVSHYVWRVVDGELIKQYVVIDTSMKDTSRQLILSGISPGDILAQAQE